MIRFLFVAAFVVLFLILNIPTAFVLYLIGKKYQDVKDRVSICMVRWAFRVCLWLSGTRIQFIGKENIPKDQAVLYVGNHRSFFDILIGYTNAPGLLGFVAKSEMIKIPLLSTWMNYLHCLFLNRTDIKEGLKTILVGIEQLKRGISMWIFPEGTRNKSKDGEGTLLPFHEGSMKMAEKSGCPVCPVAMVHTADIFENHLPRIKRTNVTVWFGDPFYLKDLDKEDRKFSGAYTQHKLQGMLDELLNA